MKGIIVGLMVAFVFGCTGTQIKTTEEMVNLAEKTQQMKILAVTDVSIACRTGLMPQQDCLMASQAYLAWQMLNSSKLSLLLMNCEDLALATRLQRMVTNGYPPLSFTPIAPTQQ